MKAEYVENSTNGAFIRLFDFSQGEVKELKLLLESLVKGKIPSLALHEHCKINPADNIHLTFVVDEQNKGIYRQGEEFISASSKDALSNIIELLGSFSLHAFETKGHQWLDETSKISLLISRERPA
jgi:hypothetical protein